MSAFEKLKALFRKPTPLERAVKELGEIEHAELDVSAEICWAIKRKEYYGLRKAALQEYVRENTK